MGEQFIGHWKQDYVENSEEFMKHLGIGYLLRTAAAFVTTFLTYRKDGDSWILGYRIAIKTGELKFKLGEEIDEVSPDGKKVKSTFTIKEDSFIHEQIRKPYDVTITRTVKEDGKLHEVCTIPATGTISKRTYLRIG